MKTRKDIINESVAALQAHYNYYTDDTIGANALAMIREDLDHWTPDDIITIDWDSMAIQSMLTGGDWHSAFEEAMCCINPAPPHSSIFLESFARDDVKLIKHIREGENDTLEWICIGQLKDGRWFNLEAGCDYTGWDCEASGSVVVADDYETLMRLGCNQETRSLFGYEL